ncbi:hypothetical protein DICVIV_10340 [Dictyocaulus viviparus]|uniref:Reverse transcriptase domain-containing protein n=1 Tax=Dictyocaulus viviparus TaxID=29172 RepID=A0A0D8XIP0_DICVI|nr:hypothetical protein DICVIV_10340 [Dictyocaulus viviparus]
MDHIHTIKRLIEVSRGYRKPLSLTFIDLKKASNPVEKETVMKALTNHALPTPYIKILAILPTVSFISLLRSYITRTLGHIQTVAFIFTIKFVSTLDEKNGYFFSIKDR